MFKPLSLYLGLRYTRSRHRGGFASFISASSIIGISLGVMVLIVVLSAMNGFEKALSKELLSLVPHGELVSVNRPFNEWPKHVAQLQKHPEVIAAAPFIKLNGMVQHKDKLKGVEVRGVDTKLELSVSNINQYIKQGSWERLEQEEGVIIGTGVANKLQVKLGDTVQLLLPRPQPFNSSATQNFAAPLKINVKVIGLFKFGGTVDETLAYISLSKASKLLGYAQEQTQGIRLKVNDVFKAPSIARQVAYQIDHYVYINDWTRTQGHLFNDIQLVRMVMFIVLAIVIAVASFNIVSTLIMAVNEKQGDIAILKTMGASSQMILGCFIIQGIINGVIGCALGGISGVYLANNLTGIVKDIEHFFNMQFLSADIYFIDFLPSELYTSDVYATIITALIMSLMATIYPAWKATKVEPAEVLGQQ